MSIIIVKILSFFVPLFLIIFGALTLSYKPFLEWSIRLENQLRGTKTEINSTTIIYKKLMAIFAIIFGIIAFYLLNKF
ncbi:MAG: hypothetical protein NTU58_00620 [Candidatus Nealsonbacteria bacterium]|nr:hypothetical protein [Candidatus Nealsonbacteria bacterium]